MNLCIPSISQCSINQCPPYSRPHTQFASVVDVQYPQLYQDFLSVLDLVNLNLGFILSFSCVVDTNFYLRLLFATISPLAILVALSATYAISRKRNRHSPSGIQASKHKHLSIALFLVYVVYSSVSYTIFQTFVCDTLDNGVTYLRADYSLTCSTATHKAMKVYAGLMMLVYPLGVPAVFAWWLFSCRHDIVNVDRTGAPTTGSAGLDHLQPMKDLWGPFKPNLYHFEVVECGRRIALTGLAAFIYPGSAAQVAVEVVLAALFEWLAPFADTLDAWLYRSGTWVISFSMYLALLLKVDASDEDSQSQESFSKVLIAANVAIFLMIFVQSGFSMRQGLEAAPSEKTGAMPDASPVVARTCCGLRLAPRNGAKGSVEDELGVLRAVGEPADAADGFASEKRVVNPVFHSWTLTTEEEAKDNGKPELGRPQPLPGEREFAGLTEMPGPV